MKRESGGWWPILAFFARVGIPDLYLFLFVSKNHVHTIL